MMKQNPVIWSKSFSVKMKLESVKMVYNIIYIILYYRMTERSRKRF